MVRQTPIHVGAGADDHLGSIPMTAIGLFISVVSALVALCAKHSRGASASRSKHATEPPNDSKFAPRALRSPHTELVLVTPIGEKPILVAHHRKSTVAEAEAVEDAGGDEAEERLGEGGGGLWHKTILMGEKCQPPEFSGVIYYDCGGNQISELPPRSPRASPLRRFSLPATTDGN
ncbi:hypothetical protein U1Q18_029509 [Sarracenia purpurea var. burkii]